MGIGVFAKQMPKGQSPFNGSLPSRLGGVGIVFCQGCAADDGCAGGDGVLDFFGDVGVLHEVGFCRLASLPDKFAVVGNPRALLFEDFLLYAEVDERTSHGNALVIHNVEFAFGKRRGDFVFDDLDFCAVADDFARRVFDLPDSADIDAHGGEEFEGASAGGRFGVAEHNADFFADLVGEDANARGFADCGGKAAHCLRHHSRLQADGGVAHLSFELLSRNEGGDGVDYDDVDCAAAD